MELQSVPKTKYEQILKLTQTMSSMLSLQTQIVSLEMYIRPHSDPMLSFGVC